MSKTIQMKTTITEGGVKQEVNGYPITTPDRVIDGNGISIETKLAEKSAVSVSATGSATDVVNYITVDGVEKKLPTGGTGNVKSVNGYTPDAAGNVTVPTGTPQEYDELVTDVATLKTGFNGLVSHTTTVSDAGSAKGNVSTDFTIESGKEYIVTNTGDTEIKAVKTYAPKSVAADEINKKVPVGESITFIAVKDAVKIMINCPTDDGGSWEISHTEKGEIDQKIDTSEKNNKTFINVKNYGAKGDGISNDRSAIQNALDYAESVGGGTVFFPKGTYCLVKTETSFAKAYVFIGNNTTLIFENGAVLKRNDHYTAHLLMGRNASTATGYDGAHNIIISGATFDCGGGDTSEWATGVCLSHLDNALIENCVFKNGGGVGHYIECNSSRFVKIVNCDFQPDATSTMYLQIEAASGHGNGGVSDNTPSTDVIIDKCRFDIGTVGGTAISDEDTDDPTNNIRITNCIFHGNTTALGFIRFTAGVKNVDIYNNTFYAGSSQVSAVNIADSTQSCCIHDNRFNGFTTPIAGSVIKYNNIIDGLLVQ